MLCRPGLLSNVLERENFRLRSGGRGCADEHWAGDHRTGDHLAGFDDDRRGRGRGCGARGCGARGARHSIQTGFEHDHGALLLFLVLEAIVAVAGVRPLI